MVLLGGLATYIDPKSSPARVSMGITTVLTISTVIQGLKSQLPAVNYLTALDVYLWACFFFVSVTLIEYAYLNYQTVVLPADKEYRRRNGAEGDRMRALTLAAVQTNQEDSGQSRGVSQARGSSTFDSKNLHGKHLDGKNENRARFHSDEHPTIYEKPNSYENHNFDTTAQCKKTFETSGNHEKHILQENVRKNVFAKMFSGRFFSSNFPIFCPIFFTLFLHCELCSIL